MRVWALRFCAGPFLRAGKVSMRSKLRELVLKQLCSHANAPTTERRSREVRARCEAPPARKRQKGVSRGGYHLPWHEKKYLLSYYGYKAF